MRILWLTMRRPMVLVAVAGVVLGGTIQARRLSRLARRHRMAAGIYATKERDYQRMADDVVGRARRCEEAAELYRNASRDPSLPTAMRSMHAARFETLTRQAAELRALPPGAYRQSADYRSLSAKAARYARLKEGYLRAAKYPLFVGPPDQTPPE